MRKRTISDETLANAYAAYKNGEPVNTIAERYGVPSPTLYRNLRRCSPDKALRQRVCETNVARAQLSVEATFADLSRSERMRRMLPLLGRFTPAVLCSAFDICPATFALYRRRAAAGCANAHEAHFLRIVNALHRLIEESGHELPDGIPLSALIKTLRIRYGVVAGPMTLKRALAAFTKDRHLSAQ